LKTTVIAWAPYQRRAEILAVHLGASVDFIYYKPAIRLLETPVRYVVQALRTWHTLRQARPDTIFVENPPIFGAMVVSLYARLYGARYVIDSHTGAFLSPKWRWSVGLHRFLSKGALVTIVHNTSQEKIVKEWGCRYLVIGFTPGSYPVGEKFAVAGQFKVAVASSFHEDEPVDLVFEAASLLPDVNFYITGDPTRIALPLLPKKPDNCFLTGYLSYEQYVGLLRGVDAIMVLTTGHHTLLMGGFEAVSVGTPLIISDWPVLRDYFSRGTIHVPNSVEGICEGVSRARREQPSLEQGILELKSQLETEWMRKFGELREILSEVVAEPLVPDASLRRSAKP
jgi:glycosyltransferase involved in cell wall biosynthesis